MSLTGSCLCRGVRYEITEPFLRANHCHCSRCRKHSGSFGLSQGRVPKDGFRVVAGQELLTVYEPVPGAARKVFCSNCGSSLLGGFWPEGDEVSVRLGSLDGDPGIKPQYHSFVADRPAWDAITDDLPRYDGAAPPTIS